MVKIVYKENLVTTVRASKALFINSKYYGLSFLSFFFKESFNLFSWLNDWGKIEFNALKDSIDLGKRKKKKNFF